MKNLFITLFLILSTFTNVIAQDSDHGAWRYMSGESYFFLYNRDGSCVENCNAIPDFTIRIQKDENGTFSVRLDEAIVYAFDDSAENLNFVQVGIIVDNSEIFSYSGEIIAVQEREETRIYLKKNENSQKFTELFNKMKNGKDIYIRTTGSGEPIVFKYSLNGFTSGYKKFVDSWVSWDESSTNPFDDSKKNPFNK